MTFTGLQQIIDVTLDATRPTLTEIQVHSNQLALGTIVAQGWGVKNGGKRRGI